MLRILSAAGLFLSICVTHSAAQNSDSPSPPDVLASVNERPITEADLELLKVRRGITSPIDGRLRSRLLDLMIERRIVEDWLATQDKPNRRQLKRQMSITRARLKQRGIDPTALLKKIGIDEKKFSAALAGSVLWDQFLADRISNDAVRAEFRQHRARYNDTKVRAKQIMIRVKPADSVGRRSAVEKLQSVRKDVINGADFAELARKLSDSPSKANGGDLGFFGFRGALPAPVAAACFALKPGELTQPVESVFGVHLLLVTDRREGTLSPEDARPQIVEAIAQREWNAILTREKPRAKIRRIPVNTRRATP